MAPAALSGDLVRGRVTFVEGETRSTVPGYEFNGAVDLVLLDGPHAYPFPQIEYAYLFRGFGSADGSCGTTSRFRRFTSFSGFCKTNPPLFWKR
jgi:hypothetical protein